MAGKNCPVCGGFLKHKHFCIFRCTKCVNRYKTRGRRFLAGTISFIGRNWTSLLAVTLILIAIFAGFWQEWQTNKARVTQLEETVAELEGTVARQAEQIAERETENQELRGQIADLEQAVAEDTAAREELQRLLEELLRQAEPSKTEITIEQGDTVWDLLTQELGRYPTWEEIQKVVDANGLESFTDGQGLWIVLIYPGQVLDLSPVLGP